MLPIVLGIQLLAWLIFLPAAIDGNADFRQVYSAGYILRSGRGRQLYDYQLQKAVQNSVVSPAVTVLPYVHLPFEALLYAPLSWLSYRHAYLFFLLLNILCLLTCYGLLRESTRRLQSVWRWFPLLLLIGFTPTAGTLMQGQDSIITLLLFTAAWLKLRRGSDFTAGFLLGLVVFKFQIALPIAVLFLAWRKWRFLAGTSSSALLALALSAFICGPRNLVLYFWSLRGISTKIMAGDQVLYIMPVARMANLRGLLFSAVRWHSNAELEGVVLILSVVILIAAGWYGRNAPAEWQFAIAVTTTGLVAYHLFTHDLSMMLIPIVLLIEQQEFYGGWSLSVFWLSTVLSFLTLDFLIALPLLWLFLSLIRHCRRAFDKLTKVPLTFESTPSAEPFNQ